MKSREYYKVTLNGEVVDICIDFNTTENDRDRAIEHYCKLYPGSILERISLEEFRKIDFELAHKNKGEYK